MCIHELLDFVDDAVDDLGSRREMNYLRKLLDDPSGTGADRQIAVYKETNDVQKVIEFLMKQTIGGIKLDSGQPLEHILKFIPFVGAGHKQS